MLGNAHILIYRIFRRRAECLIFSECARVWQRAPNSFEDLHKFFDYQFFPIIRNCTLTPYMIFKPKDVTSWKSTRARQWYAMSYSGVILEILLCESKYQKSQFDSDSLAGYISLVVWVRNSHKTDTEFKVAGVLGNSHLLGHMGFW